MDLYTSFLLNAGGLFDFDLTFVAEGGLFLLLAFVVTFVFLGPIRKQLDERAEFINYTLRKSTILLAFGYEKLSDCVGILSEEITELNRQLKLTKKYVNSNFENEILATQNESSRILSKLKGKLTIQSAFVLSGFSLEKSVDSFFSKKFQS
jgi:F0F1-type ATP synthase membrane subunit b/b'